MKIKKWLLAFTTSTAIATPIAVAPFIISINTTNNINNQNPSLTFENNISPFSNINQSKTRNTSEYLSPCEKVVDGIFYELVFMEYENADGASSTIATLGWCATKIMEERSEYNIPSTLILKDEDVKNPSLHYPKTNRPYPVTFLTGDFVSQQAERFIISNSVANYNLSISMPNLKELILPQPEINQKLNIAKFQIKDCSQLTSVVFPKLLGNNENEIFTPSFENCPNLQEVVLPENTPIIKKGFIKNCNQLKSFAIPIGVKTIESEAFCNLDEQGNKGSVVEEIFIPSSIIDFNYSSFNQSIKPIFKIYQGSKNNILTPSQITNKRLKYLQEVIDLIHTGVLTIPDELTNLKSKDFFNFSQLQEVIIENNAYAIPAECFASNGNLRKITVGGGIVTLHKGAFRDCHNLSEVIIKEGVASIMADVFASKIPNNSLKELILPSTLKNFLSFTGGKCSLPVGLERLIIKEGSPYASMSDWDNFVPPWLSAHKVISGYGAVWYIPDETTPEPTPPKPEPLPPTPPTPLPPKPEVHKPTGIVSIIDALLLKLNNYRVDEVIEKELINPSLIFQYRKNIFTGDYKLTSPSQIKIVVNKKNESSINVAITLLAGSWYNDAGELSQTDSYLFYLTINNFLTSPPPINPDNPEIEPTPPQPIAPLPTLSSPVIDNYLFSNIFNSNTMFIDDWTDPVAMALQIEIFINKNPDKFFDNYHYGEAIPVISVKYIITTVRNEMKFLISYQGYSQTHEIIIHLKSSPTTNEVQSLVENSITFSNINVISSEVCETVAEHLNKVSSKLPNIYRPTDQNGNITDFTENMLIKVKEENNIALVKVKPNVNEYLKDTQFSVRLNTRPLISESSDIKTIVIVASAVAIVIFAAILISWVSRMIRDNKNQEEFKR